MRRPARLWFVILFPVLMVSQARSGEEPQTIIARAIESKGGEANLSQAKAVQAKVKGIIYDPGVKESLVDGAKFSGELITQLPDQVKLFVQVDTAAGRVSWTHVLNGHKAWSRDDVSERSQPDDQANLSDFEQSAYVDYVSSLVPLLKDKSYALSFAGNGQVDGRPAVIIKAVSRGHPDVSLYFDTDNGLLLKNEYLRHDPATRKEVKREELFRAYQEINPARIEEQTLKSAKINSDSPALLEFLRKQTPSEETRKKIQILIRGLGDASFEARQKAKADLVSAGATAVPLLMLALKDPDPEVAGLAKECLQAIGKGPDLAAILAAIRLLGMRKPPGAAEVLLGYLPFAPDEAVLQELRAALAATGFRNGKPEQALVNALKDKDPQRQAAAAALLESGGKKSSETAGQRLLLPGLKYATKVTVKQDGLRKEEYELSDIVIFNKLDDSVFSKP
jgi:hypothetical protein